MSSRARYIGRHYASESKTRKSKVAYSNNQHPSNAKEQVLEEYW